MRKYSNEIKLYACKLINQGLSFSEVARQTGIPRSTVTYWYKPEQFKQNHLRWRNKNMEKCRQCCNNWRKLNRDKTNKNKREFHKRHKNDPIYKLRNNLHKRLSKALRRNQRTGGAIEDLGCSIQELKFRFEFFWPQYKLENYGKKWSIDHIRPLSSFNLSDREQLKIAANFSNLQPLSISENSSKGNIYIYRSNENK